MPETFFFHSVAGDVVEHHVDEKDLPLDFKDLPLDPVVRIIIAAYIHSLSHSHPSCTLVPHIDRKKVGRVSGSPQQSIPVRFQFMNSCFYVVECDGEPCRRTRGRASNRPLYILIQGTSPAFPRRCRRHSWTAILCPSERLRTESTRSLLHRSDL